MLSLSELGLLYCRLHTPACTRLEGVSASVAESWRFLFLSAGYGVTRELLEGTEGESWSERVDGNGAARELSVDHETYGRCHWWMMSGWSEVEAAQELAIGTSSLEGRAQGRMI